MLTLFVQPFFLSMLATVLLVPLVIRLAHGLRFIDAPNARKVHLKTTPLLGGLAVYVAAVILVSASGAMTGKVAALVLAIGAAALVGMIDDRFDVHSRYRLAAHFLIAGLLVAGGFRTERLPLWLDATVSLFWIAGMINAINCLDCADGIVGGISAVALACYGALLVMSGSLPLALLCFAFSGASAGFLVHNFPPARIFLGDGGSTALGLLLGAISLRVGAHTTHAHMVWFSGLPLLVPVLDIVLVHARRYRYGLRNIRDLLASAGKDHLPHRLRCLGLSPRQTMLLVAATTAIFSASALVGREAPVAGLAIAALMLGAIGLVERTYVQNMRAGKFTRAVVYVAERRVIDGDRCLVDTGCLPVSVSPVKDGERVAF